MVNVENAVKNLKDLYKRNKYYQSFFMIKGEPDTLTPSFRRGVIKGLEYSLLQLGVTNDEMDELSIEAVREVENDT
jgi:hypothetical protein